MKLQTPIIASLLVSFVCAAPFVEGRVDKAAVSINAKNLESESTNFENVGFVPRSVLRKREAEADEKAEEAVNELYNQVKSVYGIPDIHWKELDIKTVEFAKEFERVQELAKTAKDGALKRKVAFIEKMIEGNKELIKMEKIFDGCNYPGSELVIDILQTKVYALLAENIEGQTRADTIADFEKYLQYYQSRRETEYGEKMLPGLQKVFDAQIVKVKEIIKDLKEDEHSDKELSSGTDAAHDDEKCSEIAWDKIF
ncbi:hypothetical protein OXX69_006742 [Metschnikowia pulcherrima]